MIRECPHCYTTVWVQEGECPSCRKRVDDRAGTDATRTSLKIGEGARLPSSCAFCDAAEARFIAVSRVARFQGIPPEARWFLGVVLSLLGAASVAALVVAPQILVAPFLGLLVVAFGAAFLAPFLGLAAFALLFASAGGSSTPRPPVRTRHRVRVRIPVCADCRRRPLEPVAVDTEAFAMTFVVDRRFAARVRAGSTVSAEGASR